MNGFNLFAPHDVIDHLKCLKLHLKSLLFVDNASAHNFDAQILNENRKVALFQSYTTTIIQLIDQEIIFSFKKNINTDS